MAAFAIGFELKEGTYHGVQRFADPINEWREPYVKLLQELRVTLQIWYLHKSPWPNVLDKCIIYTEAANAEVLQKFSDILKSGTFPIARKCQSTCKAGTASPDWDPTPPPSPLPPDWETPFKYP